MGSFWPIRCQLPSSFGSRRGEAREASQSEGQQLARAWTNINAMRKGSCLVPLTSTSRLPHHQKIRGHTDRPTYMAASPPHSKNRLPDDFPHHVSNLQTCMLWPITSSGTDDGAGTGPRAAPPEICNDRCTRPAMEAGRTKRVAVRKDEMTPLSRPPAHPHHLPSVRPLPPIHRRSCIVI